MNHKKVYQKRLQSLDKGKAKSLGPVEKLTMRYAGWVDGRHGLLRCENGTWQSSVLKQEVDSYEEFCAGQMGRLTSHTGKKVRKVLLKCKLQLEETVNEKNRFSRLKELSPNPRKHFPIPSKPFSPASVRSRRALILLPKSPIVFFSIISGVLMFTGGLRCVICRIFRLSQT